MGKILILSTGNISKTQRIIFLSMGILFLVQGIINVFNQNYVLPFFSWIQIVFGLFYIFALILYYGKPNRTTFIKLNESEISFKKSPYSKEIVLKANDITKLDVTNHEVIIGDRNKSNKISFASLGYIQRKNELPLFIEALKEFKERNVIS